jgi:hypothetical protein
VELTPIHQGNTVRHTFVGNSVLAAVSAETAYLPTADVWLYITWMVACAAEETTFDLLFVSVHHVELRCFSDDRFLLSPYSFASSGVVLNLDRLDPVPPALFSAVLMKTLTRVSSDPYIKQKPGIIEQTIKRTGH